MSYTIMFRRKALEDYDAACLWYKNHNNELKIRFEKTVTQSLSKIAFHPKAYSYHFEDVRIMSLKKFPYLICYRVDDVKQIVTVIAVWHQARDRDILEKR